MDLSSILDPRVIAIDLKAGNKHDAIVALAKRLKQADYIDNIELFVKDIYDRESEGVTGIGNYIAIPHGKSCQVKQVGVAIGVLDRAIEWETLDGKGVKVVILFAVSNDNSSAQTQLKLLSMFARRLGDEDAVRHLVHAKTVDDVQNVFILKEGKPS